MYICIYIYWFAPRRPNHQSWVLLSVVLSMMQKQGSQSLFEAFENKEKGKVQIISCLLTCTLYFLWFIWSVPRFCSIWSVPRFCCIKALLKVCTGFGRKTKVQIKEIKEKARYRSAGMGWSIPRVFLEFLDLYLGFA